MPAGPPPARRRVVVALLAVLALGGLALGGLALGGLAPGDVALGDRSGRPVLAPAPQERPGPVLLVPGYGGDVASLRVLEARLAAAGRDTAVVPLPGTGTGDLAAAADVLGEAADAALERSGAGTVDVVGYSAGGVVARLWIAADGAEVTRRVVTLGAPHHGTTLADLAAHLTPDRCPVGCRQLASGSDLLRRLNAGDETPDGPTWVSIWSEQDRTVTPPDSSRLDGALNVTVQSVCADARVGHGELLRAPLVHRMVLAQLGPGKPVALTAADCARLGG